MLDNSRNFFITRGHLKGEGSGRDRGKRLKNGYFKCGKNKEVKVKVFLCEGFCVLACAEV